MVVLEVDGETDTVVTVGLAASVTHENLELHVGNLKLGIEVDALGPVAVAKRAGCKQTAISVLALELEATS